MKIRYVGPCTAGVTIAETGQFVEHFGEVEVDDALGASLLDQPENWAESGPEFVVPADPAAAEED